MSKTNIRLGVNIDHVATVRQARGVEYPDPLQAALAAIKGGADGITLHLREDRRHIQDADVFLFKEKLNKPINLEMAATDSMVDIAIKVKPTYVCLVPEKRQELTTEGGLDVFSQKEHIKRICEKLKSAGIKVSLFIDPDKAQIEAAIYCNAPIIEIHTGKYADAKNKLEIQFELDRIIHAADYANKVGLIVNAGHGLHYDNVQSIVKIPHINELNIGHSIIAHALFVGMEKAVAEMKSLLKIN